MPPYKVKEYEGDISCDDELLGSCGDHGTCGQYGIGHEDLVCECDKEWATPRDFNSSSVIDREKICSVERKSQLTAILLSVFLGGFGAGSFYMGWIGWGIIP